jgi:hypothetical protein
MTRQECYARRPTVDRRCGTTNTEGSMTHEFRERAIERIRGIRDMIAAEPGFPADEELRALYVCVLTLEGAALFRDTGALAESNVQFCEKARAEAIESN